MILATNFTNSHEEKNAGQNKIPSVSSAHSGAIPA
jgi:hypothetical protein